MTRYTMIILCLLTAGTPDQGLPAQQEVSPDMLLERAKAVRVRAEKYLAEARKDRLEQRRAIAAQLEKAYAELAAAQEEAKKTAHSLKRLQRDIERARQGEAVISRKIRNLLSQASNYSGAAVDESDTIEEMEKAIWNGLEKRLSGIEDDTRVTIANCSVVDRNGDLDVLPVIRLGRYASYACGSSADKRGLLRTMDDGRLLITGPHLDASQSAALSAAARGDLARLPLDVDGAMINRAPSEPKDLGSWLAAGGMFIIPIVVVGALGLLLILERVGYLALTRDPPSLLHNTLASLDSDDPDAARKMLEETGTPTSRVLLAGIEVMGKSEEERDAAMESALLAEAPRLERSLSLLGAMAGVAPLLGLLGTVSGMITTFDTISTTGTSNPRLLSGGISEALITTQLGLMIAIPLLLAHAWLRRWVERREALLEHNAIQVFGINGHGKKDEEDTGK